MASSVCRQCGKTFGDHCTVCHETFTGTKTFDAHRYGSYDGERQCLSVAQMTTDSSWRQNDRGWWTNQKPMSVVGRSRLRAR